MIRGGVVGVGDAGGGGCTALGTSQGAGSDDGDGKPRSPWNVARYQAQGRPFVLKANGPPDNVFKPLIKRRPSARPHDAETGLSLASSCSSSRTQSPRRSREVQGDYEHRCHRRTCAFLSVFLKERERREKESNGSAESVGAAPHRCRWRAGGRGPFLALTYPKTARPCLPSPRNKIVASRLAVLHLHPLTPTTHFPRRALDAQPGLFFASLLNLLPGIHHPLTLVIPCASSSVPCQLLSRFSFLECRQTPSSPASNFAQMSESSASGLDEPVSHSPPRQLHFPTPIL